MDVEISTHKGLRKLRNLIETIFIVVLPNHSGMFTFDYEVKTKYELIFHEMKFLTRFALQPTTGFMFILSTTEIILVINNKGGIACCSRLSGERSKPEWMLHDN